MPTAARYPVRADTRLHYKELRSKVLLTVVGPVGMSRPYYLCPHCSQGQTPADAQLGVAGRGSSPGVRRMAAVVGSEMPFAPACEPMKLLAGLEVAAKAIERAAEAVSAEIAQRDAREITRAKQLVLPIVSPRSIAKMYVLMDGVQVPVVAAETEGRTGRIEGQRARTRACKLGCVFTQTSVDPDGWPIAIPHPPPTWEPSKSPKSSASASTRKLGKEVGSGPPLKSSSAIWNLADQHSPGAVQIVDLYHARQHLWKIAALLHPQDPAAKKAWMAPLKTLLDDGHIEPLVMRLRQIAAEHADCHASLAEEILKEVEYFTANASRMRYPEFRKKGFFVGSGVIEAGYKSVVGARLKRSGMFWTVRGANAIIALRCCRLNGRFEDYWEESRAS